MEKHHLYNEIILDRFINPRNIGKLENENAVGEVGSSACGDIVRLSLDVDENTDVIKDAKVLVFGCQTAIAAADMMADLIKGKKVDEIKDFSNDEILNALGGKDEWMAKMPQKIHCSVLGTESVEAALDDYKKRKGIK